MSDLGRRTVDNLGEWDDAPPVTLAHWQVRMVLQALAASFDMYHDQRPSRGLPAVAAICQEEVVALLQATINDIAIQAGVVRSEDITVAVPVLVAGPILAQRRA